MCYYLDMKNDYYFEEWEKINNNLKFKSQLFLAIGVLIIFCLFKINHDFLSYENKGLIGFISLVILYFLTTFESYKLNCFLNDIWIDSYSDYTKKIALETLYECYDLSDYFYKKYELDSNNYNLVLLEEYQIK